MITIRFAGSISERILSLQQDTYIKKMLPNGNQIRIYPKIFSRYFEDSDSWKKLHNAQSFIQYLRKHLLYLLCHDSKSVYGVISVPQCSPMPYRLNTQNLSALVCCWCGKQTWSDYSTNVMDYNYLPHTRLRLRINKITM